MKLALIALMAATLTGAGPDALAQTTEDPLKKQYFCILDKNGMEKCFPPKPKTAVVLPADPTTPVGNGLPMPVQPGSPGTNALPVPGRGQKLDNSFNVNEKQVIKVAPGSLEKQQNTKSRER